MYVIVCVFVILCLCVRVHLQPHCIALFCVRDQGVWVSGIFVCVRVCAVVCFCICVRVQLQQHCIALLCAMDQGAAGEGSA